jgi:hypothetical protein
MAVMYNVSYAPGFIPRTQYTVKLKLSRYRPEQALGGSGRLRLRIFMTFGTMKVVGRQPYAPAVLTLRSILVLIFNG